MGQQRSGRGHPRSRRGLVLGGLAILLASGCGSGEPVRLWLLPPAPDRGAPGDAFAGQTIGLSTIVLPLYGEEQRITVLGPGLAATQAEDDRWAVLLSDAATSVLAEALAARTGATVLGEPFPLEARADMRIDVLATEFIGTEAGTVRLAGEFRVAHSALGGRVYAERFRIETPRMGPGFQRLAEGHAMALAGLADLVAEALATRLER